MASGRKDEERKREKGTPRDMIAGCAPRLARSESGMANEVGAWQQYHPILATRERRFSIRLPSITVPRNDDFILTCVKDNGN